MTEPPDDAAVIAASRADPERFAEIFDRHADEMHRYASWRLGADLADDVVAETFLIAFRRRAEYDLGRPDARPWLYGITSLKIRDHRRAEVRRHRLLAKAEASHADDSFDERSADRMSAEQLQTRLRSVLAQLSRADRDLLLLIAWAELSYEEAAASLGLPLGTVRSKLHRIRKKARRALGGVNPNGLFEEASA